MENRMKQKIERLVLGWAKQEVKGGDKIVRLWDMVRLGRQVMEATAEYKIDWLLWVAEQRIQRN